MIKWAVQLSQENGHEYFRLGVACDTFRGYNEWMPVQSWFFSDIRMVADGQRQGDDFDPLPSAV